MSDDRHVLEEKAARLAATKLDWNELDFVDWKEFRRMAPSVVALEVSRIERIMNQLEPGSPAYNGLVRARYDLRQFADGMSSASRDSVPDRAEYLDRALLAVSLLLDDLDSEAIRYVIQRLRYIHQRLNLIY